MASRKRPGASGGGANDVSSQGGRKKRGGGDGGNRSKGGEQPCFILTLTGLETRATEQPAAATAMF